MNETELISEPQQNEEIEREDEESFQRSQRIRILTAVFSGVTGAALMGFFLSIRGPGEIKSLSESVLFGIPISVCAGAFLVNLDQFLKSRSQRNHSAL